MSEKDGDGRWVLYLDFVRIGDIIIVHGSVVAKDKYTYKSTIPERFRPKSTIGLSAQNIEVLHDVSTATIELSEYGSIYTDYPYSGNCIIGIRIYEAK